MRECGVHSSLSFEVPPPSPPSRSRVNQGPTAMMSPHLLPATALDLRKTSFAPTPNSTAHTYVSRTLAGFRDDRNLAVLFPLSQQPSFMKESYSRNPEDMWICALFPGYMLLAAPAILSCPPFQRLPVPSGGVYHSLLFSNCNMKGERTMKIRASKTQGDGACTPSGRRTLDSISFIFRRRDIGHSLRRAPPCKLVDHLMDMITGMTLLKTMTKIPRAAAAIKRRTRIQGG
ncbi:hypothetical protein B0H13DRAFT_1996630 [Mycena leptocephala]|nr:hypothetical protein B0H13DRAFT_1996630 [Mycena leptocephala]